VIQATKGLSKGIRSTEGLTIAGVSNSVPIGECRPIPLMAVDAEKNRSSLAAARGRADARSGREGLAFVLSGGRSRLKGKARPKEKY